jgi:hypothetical protein
VFDIESLVGKKFERLLVLEESERSKNRNRMWLCQCECGKTKVIVGYNLKNGSTRSCGCLRSELLSIQKDWHKKSLSPEYKSWGTMIQRCTNPKNKKYPDYGGRGIKVCDRWKDFRNFYKDIGEKPSHRHTIDRIDVNGDYEPSNCKWSTPSEQGNNKRNNIIIEYNGESGTLRYFSNKYGLVYETLYRRIKKGIEPTTALTAIYKNGTDQITGYRQLL